MKKTSLAVKVLLLSLLVANCGKEIEGPVGPAGPVGISGDGCRVTQVSTGAVVSCPDGSVANITNGHDGSSGKSCTTTQMQNGSRIDCADGTHSIVTNGLQGESGSDGQDLTPGAYSVTELIDPCGASGGFDEVLFRLANGKLVAHFSSGGLQFLTVLSPNNYVTTDSQACHFTVNADYSITY